MQEIISKLSKEEIAEGITFLEKEREENRNAVAECCLELLDLEDKFDALQREIQDKKLKIENLNNKELHHKSLLLVLKGNKQKVYENAY